MKLRFHFLMVLCAALLVCPSAHAQQKTENCPWLNAATAGGVLGGEVLMTVTHTATDRADQPNGAPGDSTCEFTLRHGQTHAMLRIAVHTMADRAKEFPEFVTTCGSSVRRLVGVGNDAVACTLQRDMETTEQVVARVRQRVFVLSWSTPQIRGDEEATTVHDKLQNVAEQVAGSLF